MRFKTIVYEDKGPAAKIVLNRPEIMNAVNPAMAQEIEAAVLEAAGKASVSTIIICGAGRTFSAGGDIALLSAVGERSPSEVRQMLLRDVFGRFSVLYQVEKPVIAAMHGYVLGISLALALLCDIRIAEENTVFGVEFGRLGIAPESGMSLLLPLMVGYGRASELIYTARRFDALEAEKMGLISRIVPSGKLMDEAFGLAKKISELPPIALALSKSALRAEIVRSYEDAIEREATLNSICYKTEDHREAVAAFLEKRRPVFKGR